MALLGLNDMKQYLIPTGWDATALMKYRLADGTTYDQLANDIAAGLTIINGQLLSDPMYGSLFSTTQEVAVEVRNGSSNGMQRATEYQIADPRRAGTVGHMLPMTGFDRTLGWTWQFLRKARRSQIDSDLASAFQDVQDNFQKELLTRFFSNAYNTVETSGVDAAFVSGVTTPINFTPPSYGGTPFANTHTHFARFADDATGRAAALNAGALHLYEHGIMAPYTSVIPQADVAAFTALTTNWVKPDLGVQYLRTDSAANFAVATIQEGYIGAYLSDYGRVDVWATSRVPTDYLGMYKTYGTNDQRNPLRVLESPDLGFNAILYPGPIRKEFPLELAYIYQEFGVGVGDRLNGYAAHFAASGDYVVPTIV